MRAGWIDPGSGLIHRRWNLDLPPLDQSSPPDWINPGGINCCTQSWRPGRPGRPKFTFWSTCTHTHNGHAGRHGVPSGQAGTYPLVGG
eukprot:4100126-Prymnesium_polylepis.1